MCHWAGCTPVTVSHALWGNITEVLMLSVKPFLSVRFTQLLIDAQNSKPSTRHVRRLTRDLLLFQRKTSAAKLKGLATEQLRKNSGFYLFWFSGLPDIFLRYYWYFTASESWFETEVWHLWIILSIVPVFLQSCAMFCTPQNKICKIYLVCK